MTNKNLGFSYHYNDEGPNYEWLESVPTYQTLMITGFAITTVNMFSSGALAVDKAIVGVGETVYKKLALEATRSAACATIGACLIIASNSAKCGNMPLAAAFLCGATVFACVDGTAKLAGATFLSEE